MSDKKITRQVINGKHYSNTLLVSNKLAPLTTVSKKRADWYLEKGLAIEINEETRNEKFSKYPRVIKLTFKSKLESNKEPFYKQILETKCVVCGSKDNLTLHHVVPSVIRKSFPDEHKNRSHGWCVLLCEKHHNEADKLAQELHGDEIKELDKRLLSFTKRIKKIWGENYIKKQGGVENLKRKYREKFEQLNPQFIPEGFLEDHK